MWTYENNIWTWVNGDKPVTDVVPIKYGSLGKFSPKNYMSPRGFSASWLRGNRLWLFGGIGDDEIRVGSGEI